MNAAIYARYSSAGQREASIDDQLRDCRNYCRQHGYTVTAEYYDKAMTGTNDRRPEFQRMISESARGGFEVLVVWKIDRFGRNRYDSATYRHKLKKNGVRIESAMEAIPEGAEGIILESLLEGMSEYYSAALSENVRRGLYGSALQHKTLGQHFFGLRRSDADTWEQDPATAPIVAEIFQRYAGGEATLDIIADLNERGYRTATGNKLKKDFLRRIIRNEKYKGIYRYMDIEDRCIEPIVSDELWEAANKMADRHRESPAAKKEEGGFLLTGKLFCGECGKPMTSYAGTSKTGRVYNYYHCNCGKKNERKDELEMAVISLIASAILTPETIERYVTAFLEWQDSQPSAASALSQRIAETSKKLDNLVKVIESGVASETIVARIRVLENELQELKTAEGKALVKEKRFTRSDLEEFFADLLGRDINDIGFRIYLVDTFLIGAWAFEDHIVIQLNLGGGGTPTFEIAKSSKFGCPTPPNDSNTNTAFFNGCAFVWVKKYPRR